MTEATARERIRAATADARTPILAAEKVHAYYGASHVLHGVDFGIRPGETVGLMGRNGMGKTTLLRTMLGFIRPREGAVKVYGEDMTQAAPHAIARRGIAYVPEGRGIFPNLSVRENLVMAARAGVNGRRDWTYRRVLETFPRLAERLQHGGGQLSGGEQQMLTIGRALMTNPDLLILDEATEGLAPKIARDIWAYRGHHTRKRHRHHYRRQEFCRRLEILRPQHHPGEGPRCFRRLERIAAPARGVAPEVSRRLMPRSPHRWWHVNAALPDPGCSQR